MDTLSTSDGKEMVTKVFNVWLRQLESKIKFNGFKDRMLVLDNKVAIMLLALIREDSVVEGGDPTFFQLEEYLNCSL